MGLLGVDARLSLGRSGGFESHMNRNTIDRFKKLNIKKINVNIQKMNSKEERRDRAYSIIALGSAGIGVGLGLYQIGRSIKGSIKDRRLRKEKKEIYKTSPKNRTFDQNKRMKEIRDHQTGRNKISPGNYALNEFGNKMGLISEMND